MLGENQTQKSLLIRCSIIGKENNSEKPKSLFSWFSNLPEQSEIEGYVNKIWNGVTTQVFGDLCRGIIQNSYSIGGVHHFIPADSVSKYTLLRYFKEILMRSDIEILPSAEKKSNLALSTLDQNRNKFFWSLAGYEYIPSIKDMILTSLV
jgi:dTDP-4-dehydrorhamnose reductase